jgi:hypothetical protein
VVDVGRHQLLLRVMVALLFARELRLRLRLRWGSVVARHGVNGYWGIEGARWQGFRELGALAGTGTGKVVREGDVRVLLVRHKCWLVGDRSGVLEVLGDERIDEGLLRRDEHMWYGKILDGGVCI